MAKPGAIVTCLYPRIPNFTFNMDYYTSSHIPLTAKIGKPHGLLNAKVSSLGSESDYAVMVIIEYMEAAGWDATMKSEDAKQLVDDVGNFTNAAPKFFVGKVVG